MTVTVTVIVLVAVACDDVMRLKLFLKLNDGIVDVDNNGGSRELLTSMTNKCSHLRRNGL